MKPTFTFAGVSGGNLALASLGKSWTWAIVSPLPQMTGIGILAALAGVAASRRSSTGARDGNLRRKLGMGDSCWGTASVCRNASAAGAFRDLRGRRDSNHKRGLARTLAGSGVVAENARAVYESV